MKKTKKILLIIFVLISITVISGGLNFYLNFKKEEEFTIDSEVKIDPKKNYEVIYWDYPLYVGLKDDYKYFLKEKIIEFQEQYPNIKVKYRLLSPLEGKKELKKSLEEGNPPDIYNAMWGSKLVDSKLQIPINLLLTNEEGAKYSQLGIKNFQQQNKIWGLPQFLIPQVWIANEIILKQTDLELKKIQEEGWNWDMFLNTAQEIKKLEGEKYIIFNPYDEQLLFQLLATTNDSDLISEEGVFSSSSLETTFNLLENLREKEVFPTPEEKMNDKLLPYFWQEKAGIIAPVNLWLLNSIYQQNKRYSNIKLTLLPIPTTRKFNRQTPVKVTGLLLFRQQNYQGDAHTKAAYKFAQFINQQQSLYIAQKLKVIPAYLPLHSRWEKGVELNSDIKKRLLNYAQRGRCLRLINLKHSSSENVIVNLSKENYQDFWFDKSSTNQVVNNIIISVKEELSGGKNTK